MENLQDRYAPNNECFGCGPANEKGLRIKSRVEGDALVADWTPEPHHKAFGEVMNGGICGALLDCHSNWTAAYTLMKQRGEDTLPCTVTAEYSIKLKRPTPLATVRLCARPVEVGEAVVVVEAEIVKDGQVTATFRGTFVAVKEGHPAFFRW